MKMYNIDNFTETLRFNLQLIPQIVPFLSFIQMISDFFNTVGIQHQLTPAATSET